MKKRLMIITLAALMVSLLAAPVIAKSANAHHGNPNIPVITGGHGGHPEGSNVPGMAKIPNGPAGKSNIGHLYLFEKDIVSWDIIEGGAWGKMKYNLSGPTFDFVFNGHGLLPGADYTLIYYPDPWPGTGLICAWVRAQSMEAGTSI